MPPSKGTPKQKADTLRQRFGFMDEDSKTQKHDEIMLWLDQNIQTVIDEILEKDWSENTRKWAQEQFEFHKSRYGYTGEMPPLPAFSTFVINKEWERTILSKNKDPIGFIDMEVRINHPQLSLNHLIHEWTWTDYREERVMCFEVKSAIHSLGELIRQVRMYKSYYDVPYVVVSPDTRFAQTLREQGIRFVKYPNG